MGFEGDFGSGGSVAVGSEGVAMAMALRDWAVGMGGGSSGGSIGVLEELCGGSVVS